jgi:hypothetical protein
MDCSQLAAIPIFSSAHTQQFVLWTADIWDYFFHYILYTTSTVNGWHLRLCLSLYFILKLLLWTAWHLRLCLSVYYSPGAINWQSMGKKYQKKKLQFCHNRCPPMCTLMLWSTFILFAFLCGAIFHIKPYNGWPRKDQTCPVSCNLFPFSCICGVRCYASPSRFVLHVTINFLMHMWCQVLRITIQACTSCDHQLQAISEIPL